jgi:hypothetical protein
MKCRAPGRKYSSTDFRAFGNLKPGLSYDAPNKMKTLPGDRITPPPARGPSGQANIRTVLLAAVCFAVGIGAGAFIFRRPAEPVPMDANDAAAIQPAVAPPNNSPSETSQPRRTNFSAVPAPPASPATIEEVKRAIPDLASVSLADGTRMLRKAALTEFATAAKDIGEQLQTARLNLAKAQNGGSEADQQAAIQQLQQAQASQTAKLQEIAARSQAQIDALKQLKAAAP